MADDAIGVLDAYHIDEAHIVGMSLGGMIAQIVALRNPERVISITLIASGILVLKITTEICLPSMKRYRLPY